MKTLPCCPALMLLITPLQLFWRSRSLLKGPEPMPSLQDLLEDEINCEDLEIIFILDGNERLSSSCQDESTGLYPFMSAASLSACGLDMIYMLAKRNLSILSNSV